MKKLKFSFINLGCNKNLVDTQFLLWNIFSIAWNNPNYEVDYITDPYDNEVEFVFLNTCGFISSGRYEMFEEIDKLLNAGKKIYLLGCALQYFEKILCHSEEQSDEEYKKKFNKLDSSLRSEWQNELNKRSEIVKNPNIHNISRSDWDKISIKQILTWFDSKKFWESPIFKWVRAYTNIDYWFEYLKIAEWCNNQCTFCIIPKIRWKQKSLPIEDVVKQAQELVYNWSKEIILLAQDTNRYGVDLYGKSMLFELLEELEKIDWDFMYRILYLYPDILTLKHLEKLKNLKKFIPYFDIPLQHINPEILKRMWRFYDKNHILNLLDFIDKNFKERFIRTNIIVWFPWETEKEFDELCEFLQNYHFDNVALFEYHDEPLAESSKLDLKVDESEIHRRFEILKWIINENMSSWALAKDINLDSSLRSEWQWKSSKWNKNIWYIIWFEWDESDPTIIVRPRLHAPEIDEYDKIKLKNITWIFADNENLEIWDKILYKK